MNKIVIASDSFKGTLSSVQICNLAKDVIPKYFPECQVLAIPAADGGEGTVDSFLYLGAQRICVNAIGPNSQELECSYARFEDIAVIEMSAAAGLPLADKKDPETTTTFGVGQLVKHAIESGCKHILLGLGGSATNDGGCGMAAALGAVFKDSEGNDFIPTGGTLKNIHEVFLDGIKEFLNGIDVTAMCDVKNPLYGEKGAAYVYGPQKGADEEAVKRLDKGLRHLASVMESDTGKDISMIPGTGAAGGMGAGCMWFLSAALKPGADAILDAAGFDKALDNADYVITGEGRLDEQSQNGKLISAVCERAKRYNVPAIAIAGSLRGEISKDLFKKIYITSDKDAPLEELKKYAKRAYEKALMQFCEDLKGGTV